MSMCGGALSRTSLLASASPVPGTGTLRLRVNDYAALEQDGGSVRLETGLSKPVIINRAGPGVFHALSSNCQHNGCTVNPFDRALGVMRCPCHGSQYNIDGTLNQGPAARGLDVLTCTADAAGHLMITLPGITHAASVTRLLPAAGGQRRLGLAFFPAIFTSYQVLQHTTPAAPGMPVPFATTASGSADRMIYRNTVFDPDDPQPQVEVFVDAAGETAFFSIALLPYEV